MTTITPEEAEELERLFQALTGAYQEALACIGRPAHTASEERQKLEDWAAADRKAGAIVSRIKAIQGTEGLPWNG